MRNTDHTSSQDETKEKAEEKEKKEVKPHTLTSNNPHLTGGEIYIKWFACLGGSDLDIFCHCTPLECTSMKWEAYALQNGHFPTHFIKNIKVVHVQDGLQS